MRWLAPVALVALILLGINRLPVLSLLGLATLIGVVDARWLNPGRTDAVARAIRRWLLPSVIVGTALVASGLLWRWRI